MNIHISTDEAGYLLDLLSQAPESYHSHNLGLRILNAKETND